MKFICNAFPKIILLNLRWNISRDIKYIKALRRKLLWSVQNQRRGKNKNQLKFTSQIKIKSWWITYKKIQHNAKG